MQIACPQGSSYMLGKAATGGSNLCRAQVGLFACQIFELAAVTATNGTTPKRFFGL
jgi:hypothetical protein